MKKNKKIIALLSALLIVTGWTGATNFNHAQIVNASQITKLNLFHNSRIYNKKGQKLWYYQGHNAVLSTKKTLKVSQKPKAITDPRTKRYSFHDKDWNWFSLPYKTIKGKDYYEIGHGKYIKVNNIGLVNNNLLMMNQTTIKITKKMFDNKKSNIITVFDADQSKYVKKHFKLGQKVVLDAKTSDDDMGLNVGGYGPTYLFRIKGTNQFFKEDFDDDDENLGVTFTTKELLPESKYMEIFVTKDTNIYDEKGEPISQTVVNKDKTTSEENIIERAGISERIIKAVYMKLPGKDQTELFYQLEYPQNGHVYNLIKAADTKYEYGVRLKPVNTEADAMAGKFLASDENRIELKELFNRAPEVQKTEEYNYSSQKDSYDEEIKRAKAIYDSLVSSDNEVKQEITTLKGVESSLSDGKRVKVKDPNHLTKDEAKQIKFLADHVYNNSHPSIPDQFFYTQFNQDLTELDLFVDDNSTKPRVIGKKVEKLNIADYIEQDK